MRPGVLVLAGVLLPGCKAGDGGYGFGGGQGDASETAEGVTGGTNPSGSQTQSGSEAGSGDERGDETPKLDVMPGESDTSPCPDGETGGGGLTEVEFSNIWIANSPAGTVSKIDTVSGVELSRYNTAASAASDPSRTTVNLVGDVAVLNRGDGGSVIKIAAEEDRCEDRNGDGAIQTSSGPDDVLAWDADECVLWSVDMWPGARAAAWDSGNDPEADDCAGIPSLWVSAMDSAMTIHILRLAGDTGVVEDETSFPDWDGAAEWGGLYGGAVDKDRNFWAIGKDNAALFRVDFATMDVERFEGPAGVSRFYGIAMDKDGNPYVTAEFDNRLLRFDVAAGAFEDVVAIDGTLRGLAVDGDGDAWVATNGTCGVAHYDAAAGSVTPISLPECNIPVGVSIDIDGFVWVVDQWAGAPPFGRAHKIHPDSHAIETTVSGLDTPYTYSDMTGAGLNLVSFPPQG